MHARRDRLRQCRRPAQCGANRGSAQCRQPRPPCVPRHVKFVLGRRTLTDDSPVSERASTCLALLGETAARVIRVCSASLEQTQRDLRLTIALHLASNYYYYDPAQAPVHAHVRVHAPGAPERRHSSACTFAWHGAQRSAATARAPSAGAVASPIAGRAKPIQLGSSSWSRDSPRTSASRTASGDALAGSEAARGLNDERGSGLNTNTHSPCARMRLRDPSGRLLCASSGQDAPMERKARPRQPCPRRLGRVDGAQH